MSEHLNKTVCEENLHSHFHVQSDGAPELALELIEVDGAGIQGKVEQFGLLFRGPLDAPLEQGIFAMTHEKLGTFDLFVVPVARAEDGMRYHAAFNRIVL